MRYAIHAVCKSKQQLYDSIAHHKELRLYGEWKGENEHSLIGEQHSKAKQYRIDGTRSTHGCPHIQEESHRHYSCRRLYIFIGSQTLMDITDILHNLLQQTGPDTGNKIVYQKTLNAPHPFEHTAEHIKREHVEEEVRKATMHEHVCDKLIGSKISSLEKVKAKDACKVYTFPFHDDCRQEHQHIYGQKIFCSLGYSVHLWIILIHDT